MKIYGLMRPEKMYKDIIRQREIDGTTFYNKYNNDFVNVNCPACGNKGYLINENNKYIDFLLEQNEETLDNFQKFLSENKSSSHMFIIGKK